MAAASLATLPNELLEDILRPLARSDLNSLCISCKALQKRIEPFLYADAGRIIERVVHRSIGNTAIIKAARHGPIKTDAWCFSALRQLIRQNRFESFQILWDRDYWDPTYVQGRMHVLKNKRSGDIWSGTPKMFAEACRPASRHFMEYMLEHPCNSGHYMGQAVPDILLIKVLRRGDATASLVQYLLDHGADPHRCQATGGAQADPLALAIQHDQMDIFELLLARGASIHGKRFYQKADGILHIPIFTAAVKMASQGPQAVLRCVDSGSMVNHAAAVIARGRAQRGNGSQKKAFMPHPIYAYLYAIEDWDPEESSTMTPVEGVKFWLELGVAIGKDARPVQNARAVQEPVSAQEGELSQEAVRKPWARHDLTAKSLVFFLIQQRGLRRFESDGYFTLVKFLASLGSSRDEVLELRDMYNRCHHMESTVVNDRWQEVLRMLDVPYA
ncbi:uncharacterized protein B0I36DRAFT_433114 [Microdochium trichocladiopsis]|uniref:F-box domain-containing protein n=1 Tax=Microdochium trichocladiopsis TaxID=1682393 RepID=A0A9P9BNY4_9PEZI|nr:uncharacterized protein B0I36DRAFT_433114 [Microdochium trichocladiopsis]KAH7027954.1 hypothetical protein B0I36DRAFT_433114 [Microdochium trichocladiopsis]